MDSSVVRTARAAFIVGGFTKTAVVISIKIDVISRVTSKSAVAIKDFIDQN